MVYRPYWFLGLGLTLIAGCSGSPLAERLAVNPALQNSPNTSPSLPPSSPSPPLPVPSSPPLPLSPSPTSDLINIPQPNRGYIEDLAQLGIISAKSGQNFQGNSPISRREFARWLLTSNNIFYANVPAKQIRQADSNSNPTFADVPKTDPDFSVIQGLAEAGLIPSPLSNDPSASLFRPNAPLTREDLVMWKVPLDTRKALPNASLDNLKETWGFQDTAKINPKVWRSLYSDFQNGDQANIRRVFGYTTLFQPKKAVTRTEAAIALWYIGFQGDGLSAQDVLLLEKEPSPQPSLSPSIAPTPLPSPSS